MLGHLRPSVSDDVADVCVIFEVIHEELLDIVGVRRLALEVVGVNMLEVDDDNTKLETSPAA